MRPMNQLLFASLLALAAACATPPRIVDAATDTILSPAGAAAAVAGADVVVLGEVHGVAAVHRVHRELLAELHRLRPDLVLALEMFERDVQAVLDRYLAGQIEEAEFLEQARPWHGYAADYRPVIEFAKEHGLAVLAANAPRDLAQRAAKQGIAAVQGHPGVARETTAPEDSYWDAFVDVMRGHGGLDGAGALRSYYAAQCLKDDTMAESIADHLRAAAASRPLVVLICGHMHGDYGLGAVARIRSRMPEAIVRVFTAELVADVGAGVYRSRRDVADFVIVAGEPPVAPAPVPPAAPAAGAEGPDGEVGAAPSER
jgi:uncharacterized iron-regulated protein